MKIILIYFILLIFLTGCNSDTSEYSEIQLRSNLHSSDNSSSTVWQNGQEVEITGTILPSKGGTKYYIKGDNGNSAHLKSEEIAKLDIGTRIWVKGIVEYVHFPTSENSDEKIAMVLPQTLCYINVSKYEIKNP
ncbi:MAG: hypothetical protein L6416_03720 [Candidatus Omnitrophica bacterium]|nr:hypothetical protein [Candidatus Omnitrophota bacterium]